MHIAYSKLKSESDQAKSESKIKPESGTSTVNDNQKPIPAQKVPVKKTEEKSIYTLMREERFRKAALKKYAARIAAIQKVFPDWKLDI